MPARAPSRSSVKTTRVPPISTGSAVRAMQSDVASQCSTLVRADQRGLSARLFAGGRSGESRARWGQYSPTRHPPESRRSVDSGSASGLASAQAPRLLFALSPSLRREEPYNSGANSPELLQGSSASSRKPLPRHGNMTPGRVVHRKMPGCRRQAVDHHRG